MACVRGDQRRDEHVGVQDDAHPWLSTLGVYRSQLVVGQRERRMVVEALGGLADLAIQRGGDSSTAAGPSLPTRGLARPRRPVG